MKDFILGHKKTLEFVTARNAQEFQNEFFKRVNEELEKSYVKEIHAQENNIIFKASIGRFSWNGWNIFNPVTKGKIYLDIKKEIPTLTYQVFFYEFFVIALIFSLTAFSAFYFNLKTHAIAILLINWILFFFGTKLITAIRLKSFFRKIVMQINNPNIRFVSYKELFKDDISFAKEVFLSNKNYQTNDSQDYITPKT